MTPPRHATLVVVAVFVLAAGDSACDRSSVPSGDAPASRLDTPAPSTPPADHLAPNELIEGPDKAFGVVLPRGLTVEQRYPDTVYTSGPMTVHALVQYFRPRLQGGSVRESEHVATFEHVTTPGLPPNTDLSIRLAVVINKTRVEITSTTSPVAPLLPDEPSRWRQVGLTPNGKILDPTHLD